MKFNELYTEEKTRLDPKCWTGKKIGNPKTKVKGGVRVNNCVPAESVAEAAKWRDPEYKDRLYTQEPGDSDQYHDIGYGYDFPERPENDPGQKRRMGGVGSEFDGTDPLKKGQGIGRTGIKHNLNTAGNRKGLPSRDQITSLKGSIKDAHGKHHKPNLPESGVAEGSGPQVGDAVYYGKRLVGWFKGYSEHGKIITEPNYEEMGDEYANRDVYWDPQDKITIRPEQGVAEGQLEEYGDTAKGQKMLTRVQKRAVDRVIRADDKNRSEPDYTKRDLKTVRKNAATADRAWDRMTDKDLEEDFNSEYDDEAGMADNNLNTLRRAVDGLDDLIDSGDNLPEWCQEKIAVAKSMLVAVWDYMESADDAEEEDPEIAEMYEAMESLAEEMALRNRVSVDHVWETFEALDDNMLYETAAWRRKEGKSKTGGLNAKGVASYRRENPGSKLQTAVTTKPSKLKKGSKAAKRRKSFCARMSGVKGPMKKPNGKPTRKALALRKWNC